MTDACTQGNGRQHLIDALDREDALKLELEAAQKEVEQLKHRALYHESQLQEFNDLLEAEEAKTNAERITRQNAEATACHYRAEALEAKRKEKVANQHCEAAETEIFRLQRDITTERCTTATANRLLSRVREDLALAEANRKRADEQRDAVTVEVSTLRHDLATSTECVSFLEHQAKEMREIILNQHQRVEFAEKALRTMACELEDSNIKLCESMSRYEDLEAAHKQCILSTAAAAAEFERAHANKRFHHSPHERDDPEKGERCAPSSGLRQVPWSDSCMGDRMTDKLTLSTVETQTKIAPGTPLLPEPAVLTPLLASVVSYQVEPPKTSSRMLHGPRAIGKDPPWRLFYWLRPSSLCFLSRACLGRRTRRF